MTKKQKFLQMISVSCEQDAMRNSIIAAFKRNKIYNENANPSHRKKLRCVLNSEIRSLASDYSEPITEAKHSQNILSLADSITKQFAPILISGRFKIGTAQKALNLYLKFLWCLSPTRPDPPHCPLDRIILRKAGVHGAWTSLDCIDTYKIWIEEVRKEASPKSIANWELEQWNG